MPELERYKRQMMLQNFGEEAQRKLLDSKVLVVGVGGLGGISSQYLVAAGVGCVGIVDKDEVSLHNLQRQVLYREDMIGQSKVRMAEQSLRRLNSDVSIEAYECFLTQDNAQEIIAKYDIVIDGTDNYQTRCIIDTYCRQLGKPFIFGAIGEMQGQICVFNYGDNPAHYTNLFPNEPKQQNPPAVMGVLPSVVASMQVNEAIKIITNTGTIMKDTLCIIDLKTLEITKFQIKHH